MAENLLKILFPAVTKFLFTTLFMPEICHSHTQNHHSHPIMGANESANLHTDDGTIPIRRRAHTSYTRSPPDYFGSNPQRKTSQNQMNLQNNNNNNDEKHKNSNNTILTEFDVKQMMARSRAGTVCVSSIRRQSSEDAEKTILETVRQATPTSDDESTGMSKKGSITSRKSTGSHDSGVGTHPNSPIASNLHLPSSSKDSEERHPDEEKDEEKTLIPSITVSPAEDTMEDRKKKNIRHVIMKKMFKKKAAKPMRTRSKSLGAPYAMYTNESLNRHLLGLEAFSILVSLKREKKKKKPSIKVSACLSPCDKLSPLPLFFRKKKKIGGEHN
ncbi:Protein CBG11251 [Caenorhabditis briggsae]|uniref:Protein CBG11251 n=1 Tax=Caenorhabditis briggsae TaxID=6238 RepID=A8XDF6_CAEBR|nr:Protein CBG11251 [Caenorhabditis briggsae]CAP30675.1 Protein CBG11251 [Caenorhabditis briggsae]